MEGLESLGLTNNGPGFFPALQQQMEKQLLSDPEMMHCVLRSPLVQSTLSTSSPQVTRQLILSNPQVQQLLETNPEVGDMLNNTDIITQVQVVWDKIGIIFRVDFFKAIFHFTVAPSLLSSRSCSHFQVLELIRNPDLIEEVMYNEDRALGNSEPEQNVHETTTNDSDAPQQTEAKVQEHNHKLSQVQLCSRCFTLLSVLMK